MCYFPIRLKRYKNSAIEFNDVPCGKCRQCLTQKRKELQLKLFLERETARHVFFFTLTLNDASYWLFNEFEGFIEYKIKLLVLNLKYKIPDIRYFITTEYGSKTHRLHFHGLLYLQDIDQTDVLYYIQNLLYSKWPYALIKSIGYANDGGIKYVTKYLLKQTGIKRFMSSRPPLGIPFLLNNLNILYNALTTGKISVLSETFFFPKSYADYLFRNYIQLFGDRESEYSISQKLFEFLDNYSATDERPSQYGRFIRQASGNTGVSLFKFNKLAELSHTKFGIKHLASSEELLRDERPCSDTF